MEFGFWPALAAIAEAYPDREALIAPSGRHTWSDFTRRSGRFGAALADHDIGPRPTPTEHPWESPHDHVALFLHNGAEYLEAMLGAWAARAVGVNVNYRYTPPEVAHVLNDSSSAVLVHHTSLAAVVAETLPLLDRRPVLVHVDDGREALADSIGYEDFLASDPAGVDPAITGDDRYILYTGGTTGYPKGALWRQSDFVVGALSFTRRDGSPYDQIEDLVTDAGRGERLRALPAAPLMHGAAHWNALSAFLGGGTVVLPEHPAGFDATDVAATVEREAVTSLQIVGDAFARPLIDAVRRTGADLSSLRFVISGGALLSRRTVEELGELAPDVRVIDILGSSESGRQGVATSTGRDASGAGRFVPETDAAVVDDTRTRLLSAGDDEIGWLARAGRLPLGYLGDRDKTEATFPVIDSVRYCVAGDRARLRADGSIELLGRESVTINTGGEKVFAEEVEHAVKAHPGVEDVLVVGRPSEVWGEEVTAVVALRADAGTVTDDDLKGVCRERVAGYKVPKVIVRREGIQRLANGKPDYAWARDQVVESH